MTCQRSGRLEMVAGLVQCHLGNAAAEGLGSKNTIEPKAFNAPSGVFIKDAREDFGCRWLAQAEEFPGSVCATMRGREPLDAQDCHQHADE